jgi:hypothetical protein
MRENHNGTFVTGLVRIMVQPMVRFWRCREDAEDEHQPGTDAGHRPKQDAITLPQNEAAPGRSRRFHDADGAHLRMAATICAFAIKYDLVAGGLESLWGETEHAAYAAQEVKKPLATAAEKEMVMLLRRGFIMRRDAGDFHQPHLAFRNELL